MDRSVRSRRRRRSDGRVSYLVGLAVYGGLLALVNVRPGWESLPFLTSAAEPMIALLNLALIVSLAAQAVYVVDDSARLRAAATYVVALIYLVLLTHAWTVFPFDVGSDGDSWASAIRLVLGGLIVWSVIAACRAAVRVARGRRAPRLASSRTSTI